LEFRAEVTFMKLIGPKDSEPESYYPP